jgi:hypothetical protein
MSQKSGMAEPQRPLSAAVAEHAAELVTHGRREPPDDHLCTCGRLREACVSDTIRDLWRLNQAL